MRGIALTSAIPNSLAPTAAFSKANFIDTRPFERRPPANFLDC